MNVSDALEIERGIVFKQGYCKEKSLQKVVFSKDFRAGFYLKIPLIPTIYSVHLPKVANYLEFFWKKLSGQVHWHDFSRFPSFTSFGPIPCTSHDFTDFWHVSFICLDIQELVPIVPLKHAAYGNLESSSECVVKYICRHGRQTNDVLVSRHFGPIPCLFVCSRVV